MTETALEAFLMKHAWEIAKKTLKNLDFDNEIPYSIGIVENFGPTDNIGGRLKSWNLSLEQDRYYISKYIVNQKFVDMDIDAEYLNEFKKEVQKILFLYAKQALYSLYKSQEENDNNEGAEVTRNIISKFPNIDPVLNGESTDLTLLNQAFVYYLTMYQFVRDTGTKNQFTSTFTFSNNQSISLSGKPDVKVSNDWYTAYDSEFQNIFQNVENTHGGLILKPRSGGYTVNYNSEKPNKYKFVLSKYINEKSGAVLPILSESDTNLSLKTQGTFDIADLQTVIEEPGNSISKDDITTLKIYHGVVNKDFLKFAFNFSKLNLIQATDIENLTKLENFLPQFTNIVHISIVKQNLSTFQCSTLLKSLVNNNNAANIETLDLGYNNIRKIHDDNENNTIPLNIQITFTYTPGDHSVVIDEEKTTYIKNNIKTKYSDDTFFTYIESENNTITITITKEKINSFFIKLKNVTNIQITDTGDTHVVGRIFDNVIMFVYNKPNDFILDHFTNLKVLKLNNNVLDFQWKNYGGSAYTLGYDDNGNPQNIEPGSTTVYTTIEEFDVSNNPLLSGQFITTQWNLIPTLFNIENCGSAFSDNESTESPSVDSDSSVKGAEIGASILHEDKLYYQKTLLLEFYTKTYFKTAKLPEIGKALNIDNFDFDNLINFDYDFVPYTIDNQSGKWIINNTDSLPNGPFRIEGSKKDRVMTSNRLATNREFLLVLLANINTIIGVPDSGKFFKTDPDTDAEVYLPSLDIMFPRVYEGAPSSFRGSTAGSNGTEQMFSSEDANENLFVAQRNHFGSYGEIVRLPTTIPSFYEAIEQYKTDPESVNDTYKSMFIKFERDPTAYGNQIVYSDSKFYGATYDIETSSVKTFLLTSDPNGTFVYNGDITEVNLIEVVVTATNINEVSIGNIKYNQFEIGSQVYTVNSYTDFDANSPIVFTATSTIGNMISETFKYENGSITKVIVNDDGTTENVTVPKNVEYTIVSNKLSIIEDNSTITLKDQYSEEYILPEIQNSETVPQMILTGDNKEYLIVFNDTQGMVNLYQIDNQSTSTNYNGYYHDISTSRKYSIVKDVPLIVSDNNDLSVLNISSTHLNFSDFNTYAIELSSEFSNMKVNEDYDISLYNTQLTKDSESVFINNGDVFIFVDMNDKRIYSILEKIIITDEDLIITFNYNEKNYTLDTTFLQQYGKTTSNSNDNQNTVNVIYHKDSNNHNIHIYSQTYEQIYKNGTIHYNKENKSKRISFDQSEKLPQDTKINIENTNLVPAGMLVFQQYNIISEYDANTNSNVYHYEEVTEENNQQRDILCVLEKRKMGINKTYAYPNEDEVQEENTYLTEYIIPKNIDYTNTKEASAVTNIIPYVHRLKKLYVGVFSKISIKKADGNYITFSNIPPEKYENKIEQAPQYKVYDLTSFDLYTNADGFYEIIIENKEEFKKKRKNLWQKIGSALKSFFSSNNLKKVLKVFLEIFITLCATTFGVYMETALNDSPVGKLAVFGGALDAIFRIQENLTVNERIKMDYNYPTNMLTGSGYIGRTIGQFILTLFGGIVINGMNAFEILIDVLFMSLLPKVYNSVFYKIVKPLVLLMLLSFLVFNMGPIDIQWITTIISLQENYPDFLQIIAFLLTPIVAFAIYMIYLSNPVTMRDLGNLGNLFEDWLFDKLDPASVQFVNVPGGTKINLFAGATNIKCNTLRFKPLYIASTKTNYKCELMSYKIVDPQNEIVGFARTNMKEIASYVKYYIIALKKNESQNDMLITSVPVVFVGVNMSYKYNINAKNGATIEIKCFNHNIIDNPVIQYSVNNNRYTLAEWNNITNNNAIFGNNKIFYTEYNSIICDNMSETDYLSLKPYVDEHDCLWFIVKATLGTAIEFQIFAIFLAKNKKYPQLIHNPVAKFGNGIKPEYTGKHPITQWNLNYFQPEGNYDKSSVLESLQNMAYGSLFRLAYQKLGDLNIIDYSLKEYNITFYTKKGDYSDTSAYQFSQTRSYDSVNILNEIDHIKELNTLVTTRQCANFIYDTSDTEYKETKIRLRDKLDMHVSPLQIEI